LIKGCFLKPKPNTSKPQKPKSNTHQISNMILMQWLEKITKHQSTKHQAPIHQAPKHQSTNKQLKKIIYFIY
jgi:hypothetical protein